MDAVSQGALPMIQDVYLGNNLGDEEDEEAEEEEEEEIIEDMEPAGRVMEVKRMSM